MSCIDVMSPLFPYTTLFRSCPPGTGRAAPRAPRAPARAVEPGPCLRPTSTHRGPPQVGRRRRSEEHTSELQSRGHLVCRLLLEKKNRNKIIRNYHNSIKYT